MGFVGVDCPSGAGLWRHVEIGKLVYLMAGVEVNEGRKLGDHLRGMKYWVICS